MKRSSLKYAVLPAAVGLVSSFAMAAPAAAADTVSKTEAAQSAVNKYGGCTIGVDDDDYDGDPAWEVELRDTTQNTDNGGRVEVKVNKASGDVITESLEQEDSDDNEQCDSSLPASDSENDDSGNDESDNSDSNDSNESGDESSESSDESTTPEITKISKKVTTDEFEDSDKGAKIIAEGYSDGEKVTIKASNSDAGVKPFETHETANSNGVVAFNLYIRSGDAPTGTYTVTLKGEDHTDKLVDEFKVVEGSGKDDSNKDEDSNEDDSNKDESGNDDSDQNEESASASVAHQSIDLSGDREQTVKGMHFTPGEEVSGTLHSNAVDLGNETANKNGVVTFTFDVPKDVDPGNHTVTLEGPSKTASVDFTVKAGEAAATTKPEIKVIPKKVSTTQFANEDKGVKIVAKGYDANEAVTLKASNETGDVKMFTMSGQADDNGIVTFQLYAVGKAVPGTYTVTLEGKTHTDKLVATFEVVAPADNGGTTSSNDNTSNNDNASSGDNASNENVNLPSEKTSATDELPRTGINLAGLYAGGGMLLLGGAALALGRRRKSAN